jgi:phage I-like protein
MFSKHATQHASLSFQVAPAAVEAGAVRIQLLPAGYFSSEDGRPGSLKGVTATQWRLTMEDAWKLITALEKSKNQMVFDYEHQTLLAADNGQPAPAAGWCKKLEWVDGQGLFATDVQWTDKARAMILAGEYKYISPVFEFDKTSGVVTRLVNAALTNNPALDGMEPVMAALSKQLSPTDPLDDLPKELPMKLLLAALGLLATATETEAVAALAALQTRADTATANVTQVAALTANQFDATKHIPLSEHTKVAEQLAALTATAETAEQAQLMTAALGDCRILPANEAYWRGQPVAVLRSFLKDAQPLAALKGLQTNGKPPEGDPTKTSLSAEELAVCKTTGLTPEQFIAAKGV